MPISTIGQNGLNAPITLTSPVINTVTSASGSTLQLQSNGGTTALTVGTNQALTVASTGSGITYSSSSSGNVRVYGGSAAHQWDVYGNGNNLRFSDNTGGGSLVVDTPTVVPNINSASGSLSVSNNSATQFANLSSLFGSANGGAFLVNALSYGAGSERIAFAIVVTLSQGGGTARFALQNNGANMTITDPNSNGVLYVTQTSGSTITVNWSVLRMY